MHAESGLRSPIVLDHAQHALGVDLVSGMKVGLCHI
jgi:hypothetical protein